MNYKNNFSHISGVSKYLETPTKIPLCHFTPRLHPWHSSAGECRIHNIFERLSSLEKVYPSFKDWYFSKVVPGLLNGTRRIVAEYDGDMPVAVVIAKRTASERKLCTIWVNEDARGHRASQVLMKSAIQWLDCERPLVSANEGAREMLSSTFKRMGFIETGRKFGYYTLESAEYFYNSTRSSYWRN